MHTVHMVLDHSNNNLKNLVLSALTFDSTLLNMQLFMNFVNTKLQLKLSNVE